MNLGDVMEQYRHQYGEIYKLPGMFGKPDTTVVFDPKDFEAIYRTEGVWPVRPSLETVSYYRKKIRPDIYSTGGLANEYVFRYVTIYIYIQVYIYYKV